MSHTPGPWAVDEVRTSAGRAFRIGAGEMLVAGKGCCIIYDDYPSGEKSRQREANARLIAAAPEMYEFLRHMREVCSLNTVGAETRAALEAILAKAEGP